MGQVKKTLMDFQEKVSIINEILMILSSDRFKDQYEPQLISDLYSIDNMIESLDWSSFSVMNFISNVFTDDFYDICNKLIKLADDAEFENSSSINDNLFLRKLINDLWNKVVKIKNLIQEFTNNNSHIYNSEDYYSNQIQTIQKQKNDLEKYLKDILLKNDDIQGRSQKEREIYEKRIQEKELQLQIVNQQLEEKIKQENAITEWNTKIKNTFIELKKYLEPIKNEHRRLKILFGAYSILTGLVILFIVILEIIICAKFYENETIPVWKDCLVLMIPIPVTVVLLWAFISQLNRAQRQLVILAKHIHEIEYIEGLLLSLNSLSIDINDSMKRVNSAIDRLLDNHLSLGSKHSKYDENSIVKEEKKDLIPTDLVFKLLKEMKGLYLK